MAVGIDGFRLEPNVQGTLSLRGAISYENAAEVLRATPQPIIDKGGSADIDLSALQAADSATLAVLIAWAARSRTHGTQVHYRHAPQSLLNLARLSDVATLLGLEDAA